jgi:glycosyl transferase family 2
MSLVIKWPTSGVKKTGPSEYDAITHDPHFVYRFWLRRPSHILIYLESLDNEALDPKIYADRGNGFQEATAVSLQHSGACIYSILIAPPRKVARIRIDPCSCEARLRYRIKFAWRESKFAELLTQERQIGDRSASVYDVVIDGTPEKRTRQKPPKRVADHFASVVRLAEHTAPPIDASIIQNGPFISFIVPVYNTSQLYLDELLVSFYNQPAESAELILCDDGSTSPQTLAWLSGHEQARDVRVVHNPENKGIAFATNSGIAVARGEWIGFVDHDDALTPCVVQLIAQTARDHPGCKLIYTDEVVTDEKLNPVLYFLKPAFDQVLLSGVNYINHLSCYRRDRLIGLGGLRVGFDGSQDYDLLLRYVSGLKANEIKHLPYPGYRWRRTDHSFSARFIDRATANARKAIAEHYRSGEIEPIVDQAIAKSLLGLDVDVLAAEVFALPRPFRKARTRAFGRAQPPFVFVPALGEIAPHQEENAEPGMRIGMMRRQGNRVTQGGDSLLEGTAMVQRRAEIGERRGMTRIERHGPAIGCDRLVVTPLSVERVAEIAVRISEIRAELDCLAVRPLGLGIVLQLVERDAEIGVGHRHRPVDGDGSLCRFGGEARPPDKPQHLTEIGVVERGLRREFGGVADVLDRLVELAALMRDETEQMLGVWEIRLRGEDTLEQVLRFRQAALDAPLLGEQQRLAERQRLRWRADLRRRRLNHTVSYHTAVLPPQASAAHPTDYEESIEAGLR